MLATINTPKVQAPSGVSLLHLVLIIQGYNQNYMKKNRFIIHLIIHEMKMLSINFYNFHIHKCCLFYRKKRKKLNV